jgi:hypothetical protein
MMADRWFQEGDIGRDFLLTVRIAKVRFLNPRDD